MTMQIVLRAKGGLVVASDTKIRTRGQEFSARDVPFGIANAPKVRFSKQHDLAVAFSGWGTNEGDLAEELAEYLSKETAIPDNLTEILTTWGNRFFELRYPGQKHDFPLCTLLVGQSPRPVLPHLETARPPRIR